MNKVIVFTGAGIRHRYFIERLANAGYSVTAFVEEKQSFSSWNSENPALVSYFQYVRSIEAAVFDRIESQSVFVSPSLTTIDVNRLDVGHVSNVPFELHSPSSGSVFFIVFGSSFIKDPLLSKLIGARAINLHLGIAPFFRGSGCNFWAVQKGYPHLVGASILRLNAVLDGGEILAVVREITGPNPVLSSMHAVKNAIDFLVENLADLYSASGMSGHSEDEIFYSKNKDLTPSELIKFCTKYGLELNVK